jgi:hypothetical protein
MGLRYQALVADGIDAAVKRDQLSPADGAVDFMVSEADPP